MLGILLAHGDIWTVLAGIMYLAVLYLVLPIIVILLIFRFVKKVRR